ncbi:helix-turn-helix domain containing protein [Streptomyces sp. NPDC055013]
MSTPRRTLRRTTVSGARSWAPIAAFLITPTRSGTGCVGARPIASGSARLRALIVEAARLGLRPVFTVRLAETSYVHHSGSRAGSPGIRCEAIMRPTTPRNAPTAPPGLAAFDAAYVACRVDVAGGDATSAVHQWLVETGRIRPGAQIVHLEVCTWRPR